MKGKKVLSASLALTMLLTGSMSNVGAVYASTRIEQGPGPSLPLDVKELGKFKASEGWKITGATQKDTAAGASYKLTAPTATISKEFTYATWDYSDLSIQIKKLTEGMKWKLSVKAADAGSKEMVIQPESGNANSQFGEAFKYSLEGIAGAEAMSNWNDESVKEKTFTLTLTLTGKVDDEISLGELKRIKPNYTVPTALPSNVKGTIGNVNFDGDPKLDVDTLRNDDTAATSAKLKEHQWVSLPYSRLVINPDYTSGYSNITPPAPNLDLTFGVYYGIKGNANKTQIGGRPINDARSAFQASSYNAVLNAVDATGKKGTVDNRTVKTAWYPHKAERAGDFYNGMGHVDLIDYMIDKNTIGRIIDTSNMNGNTLSIGVQDSTKSTYDTKNSNNLVASWDDKNNVVLKTDALETDWNTNLFYQAMRVVALNADGSYNAEKTALINTPTFTNGKGEYRVPDSVNKIGIVIGYSNREEGQQAAIDRALASSKGNLVKSYEKTKDFWNEKLRKVPAPTHWGIDDENVYNKNVVTEENHKVLYYSGWVLNMIDTLAPTPETGYNYTQQSLGKPSRDSAGPSLCSSNNNWEGLLQIQDIMYTDPSAAWSGMEGYMSMVDANGSLNGEVLPVRMGQTLWMIHSISPDIARLEAMYPALKRHVVYKIANPRWVWEENNTKFEIDQEFITSMMNDVIYIQEICKELGGEYEKEIKFWQAEYDKALANYADWFFCDPSSHEAKGSYPQDNNGRKTLRNGAGLADANQARGLWTRVFVNDGDVHAIKDACTDNTEGPDLLTHNKEKHKVSPDLPRAAREWLQVPLAGLVIKDIPTAQLKQLMQLMLDVNNPALSISGIENLKWAPASLFLYGIINRGFYDEAKNQLDGYLVKAVEIWGFCENYGYRQSNTWGTRATSFGASQIIELTMMKNGIMNDGSGVKPIKNWDEGMNKAKNPDVNFYLEGEYDAAQVQLPKEVTQVYEVENFNGEKYTLNKVTAVKWDMNSLTHEGNTYFIKGETETHDEIIATVYTHVDENLLIETINKAKTTAQSYEDKDNYYSKDAYDNLNKEIEKAEALLDAATKTTEEIGQEVLALEKAIEAFVESPLVTLTEEVKAFVAEIDTDDYKQEDIDAINALVNKVEDSVASKNLTEKEVEALYKELSEGFEAFKAAKIERLPWTPLEPSKPLVPWTPLEPAKPIDKEDKPGTGDKEEKPDTSDKTSFGYAATLAMAALGMALLRKKKED